MNRNAQTPSPAEIYDRFFVPALFAQWGPIVAGAADVKSGDQVLDVACGTGALTQTVAELVGATGRVVGLDANPEMLAVARNKPTAIEWIEGKAEALPLPDRTFNAIVSQFGFMFFEDRVAALREMMRVLLPGGRIAVAVCDNVDNSPGYSAFAKLLDRLFGNAVGNAFRAPFILGDAGRLLEISLKAGIPRAKVRQHQGKVRFRSIEALVSTERACVWTLGGILSEEQFAILLQEAENALQAFVAKDGSIEFDMPALVVTAQRSD